MKNRRIKLKENGVCVVCGKRPAIQGKVRCEICTQKKKEKYYEERKILENARRNKKTIN